MQCSYKKTVNNKCVLVSLFLSLCLPLAYMLSLLLPPSLGTGMCGMCVCVYACA